MDPTEVFDQYWLFATRKEGSYFQSQPGLSGKWLIFAHKSEINQIWSIVEQAIEVGKLGNSAKVSTSKSNPNSINPEQHVICVYTYNHEDEEDVMRIREELRKIGITQKIPYKTDIATLQGKYANRGDQRISKYYC